MKEQKLLYDHVILAQNLEDLRNGDGKNKYTFEQLSNEIEKKTGVSISHTQLRTYENPDATVSMSINNLLAIAKFYDVSLDFLLGKTNSKKHNYTDKMASNRYSLSDETIKQLCLLTNNRKMNKNDIKLKFINCFIENSQFLSNISDIIFSYYELLDKLKYLNEEERKNYAIMKYDLLANFEELVNSNRKRICQPIKRNYLFDMPEQENKQKGK